MIAFITMNDLSCQVVATLVTLACSCARVGFPSVGEHHLFFACGPPRDLLSYACSYATWLYKPTSGRPLGRSVWHAHRKTGPTNVKLGPRHALAIRPDPKLWSSESQWIISLSTRCVTFPSCIKKMNRTKIYKLEFLSALNGTRCFHSHTLNIAISFRKI